MLALVAAVAVGVPSPSAAAAVTASPAVAATADSPTAGSATATDVAAMVLARINAARAARDLVPYRAWDALSALAAERAGRMAASRTLSHAAAGGDIGAALDARSIPWLGYGETIGMTGWAWGDEAADSVVGMWLDSAGHRALLLSADYNYAGIGAARAADGSTWVSAVMTESPDHTPPIARVVDLTRVRRSITLRWAGSDPRLQTHTAGVRYFDVRFRRDDRAWRRIRNDTTATSLTLRDRARGHWYLFRVRARDARGNLSRWTTETRIWVP
jgi:uncharacterized protein YkwD